MCGGHEINGERQQRGVHHSRRPGWPNPLDFRVVFGGWKVETEPRVVQLDKKGASRKFHACKKRTGMLVMQHYAWVVGWRGYKNIHAIGGKSFGLFDKKLPS